MVLDKKFIVFLVGYAHIDSEWLWSLDETVNFCRNTFVKALELMKRYPSLIFVQGGILCFELLEERYPEFFQKVCEAVRKGRWEVAGAYLEFDAYMSSGESILRHLLYGAEYLSKFGLESAILFLPDSFGFPNTLPKLMKSSGIRYFVTYKPNWNDTNEFPYNVFRWRSSNGSEVIAYVMPGSYSNYLSSIKRILWNISIQMSKQGIPTILQIYGRGDHGGGPDEIELINIIKWAQRYSPLLILIPAPIEEFFKYVERLYGDDLPSFNGELYLEFHRGVYTTGALVKKLNRINEILAIEVEKLYSILKVLYGESYPRDELTKLWKMVLLNQGHDALSATVPEEVYEVIIRRGLEAYRGLLEIIKQGLRIISIKEKGKYIIFNPNSWPVSLYITTTSRNVDGYHQRLGDGSSLFFTKNIPPLGFRIFSSLGEHPDDEAKISERGRYYILENKFLRVTVSKDTGWIVSIYDNRYRREVLSGPVRLKMLWDHPLTLRGRAVPAVMFDAWETFYIDGINKFFNKDLKAYSHEVSAMGPLYVSTTFRYRYRQLLFGDSYLELEIGIYAGKPFVEVRFRARWKALHRFLKLVIPVNIDVGEAVFEVPYGVAKRRDSCKSTDPVDRARYEVPGQRWVDISNGSYGVAIISDSRYGFSWCNGVLGVSLLRSPLQPLKKLILKSIEEYVEIEKRFRDISFQLMNKAKQRALWFGLLIVTLILKLLNLRKLRPIDHGYHSATIWIYPHQGDYIEGGVNNIASELTTRYIVIESDTEGIEKSFSLLEVEPSDKVHVTAVKPCEYDNDCLAIRLFNISPTNITARLKLHVIVNRVYKATHREKPVYEIPIDHGNTASISLTPLGVETLMLKLSPQQSRRGNCLQY